MGVASIFWAITDVLKKKNIFTWLSLQKQTFSDFENREKDLKKNNKNQ